MESSRHGLAGDGKGTVAATGKGVAVEFRGVYASANREIGKNLAIIRTHDDQLLRLSTPDEQAASHRIHRHTNR